MGDRQNLEVQITWRDTGLRSEWYRIHADPDDTEEMLEHLTTLAKAWRNLPAVTYWLPEYEMKVKNRDKPWLPEFNVTGLAQK